ncbi:MAG: alpha/beta hydrolase fold domain-containing protein [Acetobacteraceae bacterium]
MEAMRFHETVYLRHGARALTARLLLPAGVGPHPAVVALHGGAWCKGTRADCDGLARAFAAAGIAVAALDFRDGADLYPSSLADINFGVRWLKAQAPALGLGRVGIVGQSSGGHLAMLAAMRPTDPRYAALPGPEGAAGADASVGAVAMLWPVINPLSRYWHAGRARAEGAGWVGDIPERQDLYWRDAAAMAEGNPLLALERGESVRLPPALWLQGRPDPAHDYHDPEGGFDGTEPDRFAARYRAAGGALSLLTTAPADRDGPAALAMAAAFLRATLG